MPLFDAESILLELQLQSELDNTTARPLLSFLRTFTLHVHVKAIATSARLLLVEHFTARWLDDNNNVPEPARIQFLESLVQIPRRCPCLVTLHLDHCATDLLLYQVAMLCPRLRRLLVPSSDISQEALNVFTRLEELDIGCTDRIHNVHFCSASLRRLHAQSVGMKDEGLSRCVHLTFLDVSDAPNITTVAPFADFLEVLDASGGACGISDSGLSLAYRIVKLNVSGNTKVTTVNPFAESLRELHAIGKSDNPNVTMVSPFSESLRELHASGSSRVRSYYCGLNRVKKLVLLSARDNNDITTVAPFADSLRVLDASGARCGICDQGLSKATRIVSLNVSKNYHVKTVAPFAESLLVLDASGLCCGLNDSGLLLARNIVKLTVYDNLRVTTALPFTDSLRELDARR